MKIKCGENDKKGINKKPMNASKSVLTKNTSVKPIVNIKSKAPIVSNVKQEEKTAKVIVSKPSDKIAKIKTNDTFIDPSKSSKTKPSGFQYYYHNGYIPCKINHGSITNKLFWPNDIDLSSELKRNSTGSASPIFI